MHWNGVSSIWINKMIPNKSREPLKFEQIFHVKMISYCKNCPYSWNNSAFVLLWWSERTRTQSRKEKWDIAFEAAKYGFSLFSIRASLFWFRVFLNTSQIFLWNQELPHHSKLTSYFLLFHYRISVSGR